MSDEQRIRELAYQIWEAEGRPDGEQDRHWTLASRLASEAVRVEIPTPKARVSRSRPRAASAETVETPPAAIHDSAVVGKRRWMRLRFKAAGDVHDVCWRGELPRARRSIAPFNVGLV